MILGSRLVIAYRTIFAALTLAALTTQFADGIRWGPGFNPVGFFSYFTILINTFTMIILGHGAWLGATRRPSTPRYEWLRGANTTLFVVSGAAFIVLLASAPAGSDQTAPYPGSTSWCTTSCQWSS